MTRHVGKLGAASGPIASVQLLSNRLVRMGGRSSWDVQPWVKKEYERCLCWAA